MKVYFIVFFLTLILSVVLPAKTDKQLRWKLFWMFLPLFLFAALRVDFGNDYSSYEFFFNEYHTSKFMYDEDSHSEIGYQFLCYLMPSFRSMLVLNAFLLCLALSVFIYRNVPSKYLWLAVLLIFLNPEKNIYGNLVGMRNGFVVTGFLLGFILIQKRKLIWFALLTALLSTIHTAALLFLPIAYLVGRNTPISKTEISIWIGVFIVLLGFSMSGLIDLVSPIISQYFDRYEYYIEEMSTGHRGFLLTITSLVLAVLIFSLYKQQEILFTKDQSSLVRLGLVYVASAFLGSLAVRANYFYDMFFIGTVVVLYSNSKRNFKVIVSRRKSTLKSRLYSNSKHNSNGTVLMVLAVLMSFYSLRLYMTNAYVANNPLYQVYTSIIGSW